MPKQNIELHRLEINNQWRNEQKIGCIIIKPALADFFRPRMLGFVKKFNIAAISPFVYDRYESVDYITFNQKAILGEEPVIYTEICGDKYQRALENELSTMLAFSMQDEWAKEANNLMPFLEYKEMYIKDLENQWISNKLLSIRIAKDFLRSTTDYSIIDNILDGFHKAEELKKQYRDMPQKYRLIRNGGKVELMSEVVKQELPNSQNKHKRYFSYFHNIWVSEHSGKYYVEMENSLRKILLELKNKDTNKLVFYRNSNRNILFTQNGDAGISLSSLQISKGSLDKIRLTHKQSESYAVYNGLGDKLKKFGNNPVDYLYGDTCIYAVYLPEDNSRLWSGLKSGSGLTERYFEYISYQARLNYLQPVTNEIKRLEITMPCIGTKKGYRSLDILSDSKKWLREKEVLRIGIVTHYQKSFEEYQKRIFNELSYYFDDAKVPFVYFKQKSDKIWSVIDKRDEATIIDLEINCLNWLPEVFGHLNDVEINNFDLRRNRVRRWLKENPMDAVILGVEQYEDTHATVTPKSRKGKRPFEKSVRDPKALLRVEFTRANVINQFVFNDREEDTLKDIFIHCMTDVLSRVGFVQSIFNDKRDNELKDFIFFDLIPVGSKKDENYHLVCNQMTDEGIDFFINKNLNPTSIHSLFAISNDILSSLKKPMSREEVEEQLELLNGLSEEKIWVFPKRYVQLLPSQRIKNFLYTPFVKTTHTNTLAESGGLRKFSKTASIFYQFPNEIFIVPESLNTDRTRFSDIGRRNTNKKPFLIRSKFVINTTEELYDRVEIMHLLMYINAQFQSSSSVPYPLHAMKYVKEVLEALRSEALPAEDKEGLSEDGMQMSFSF